MAKQSKAGNATTECTTSPTEGLNASNLRRHQAALALFACALLFPNFAQAQNECGGVPGTLVNGSFEQPLLSSNVPPAVQTFGQPPTQVRIYTENNVPGWETTAPNNLIELWQSGFNGVTSFDGAQHAEVNASQFGAFFQDLQTDGGTELFWHFAHRGRNGVDTMEVMIGPVNGPLTSQGIFQTGPANWIVYSGRYNVPLGQTVTRFQFESIATSNGSQGSGNFVDDLRIVPNCDYGDAPASFPVLRSNNGAAHLARSNAFLGALIDTEVDGLPSNAESDDARDTDDEDGVLYGHPPFGTLFRNIPNNITIDPSLPGFVSLWIDLNGDGTWGTGERLLADVAVTAGQQEILFVPPAATAVGSTFARLRYTSDDPNGALGTGGDWANGEVEDDLIVIEDSPPPNIEITKTSAVEEDPINQTNNPKSIPGATVVYTITVANLALGSNDLGSLVVTDDLPAEVEFFSGDFDGAGSPFLFTEVTPNSGVHLDFTALSDTADDVVFEDAANSAIVPNGSFDPSVRAIRFEFDGQLTQSGATYTIQFRARVL